MDEQYIIKFLLGAMDQDSPNENIGPHHHREAWNFRFNGPKGNERPEIINGNRIVPGQSFLPSGVNKMIGWKEDSVYHLYFLHDL